MTTVILLRYTRPPVAEARDWAASPELARKLKAVRYQVLKGWFTDWPDGEVRLV